MKLISLNVDTRSGKTVGAAMLIDVTDIGRPIEPVGGAQARVWVREWMDKRETTENIDLIEYVVNHTPAAIAALSPSELIVLSVTERRSETVSYTRGFLVTDICGYIKTPGGGGSQFMYREGGDIRPVEYKVSQNLATILSASTLSLPYLPLAGGAMNSGAVITASNPAKTHIDFGTIGNEYFQASSDGGLAGQSGIYFDSGYNSMYADGYNQAVELNVAGNVDIYNTTGQGGNIRIGVTNGSGIHDNIFIGANYTAGASSSSSNKSIVVIGSKNSGGNMGVVNSVILGGSALTAVANDTVYTANLNVTGTVVQTGATVALNTSSSFTSTITGAGSFNVVATTAGSSINMLCLGAGSGVYITTNGFQLNAVTGGTGGATIDADDLSLGGAGRRVGFYGVTPVVKPAALTAANAGVINSGDGTTDAVIGNLRTRLGELEARLQGIGLLS